VLLAWAEEDRLFPLELAHRLAGLLPQATLVTIKDSYTFVPEDQPESSPGLWWTLQVRMRRRSQHERSPSTCSTGSATDHEPRATGRPDP
jgi:hypothetical protein